MAKRSGWTKTVSRHDRGYGREWELLRAKILRRDSYLCQCKHCKASGRIRLATEVDHIISKKKAVQLGWTKQQIDDPSNLQSIHKDCHKRKTHEDEGRTYIPRPEFGVDGWPIGI